MNISIQSSFQRSVNLVRDFYGEHEFDHYIVTAKSLELIERTIESLKMNPPRGNAWSITGPYGGGKSSFALYLSHLLAGNRDACNQLEKSSPSLFNKLEDLGEITYCPILIVGSREPLNQALLRGLIVGASTFRASFARHRGKPNAKINRFRRTIDEIIQEAEETPAQDIHDEIVLNLYQRIATSVNSVTNGGLLIIVDELGKFLEFASFYPDQGDLYLLQKLAEHASAVGSTSKQNAPMLLFTISHQAFERYSGRLSSSHRDEWRKIQGRFEDIAFVEPPSETLRLLAMAIQVTDAASLPKHGIIIIDRFIDAVTYPHGMSRSQIRSLLVDALPLHPAVSLIVGPLFRRLAQHQRSLFTFLSSGEPFSFLDILTKFQLDGKDSELSDDTTAIQMPQYRLDHLYDYVVGPLNASLSDSRIVKLWAETEAVLARLNNPDELTTQCIKQIALMNFAGSFAGLYPTAKVLQSTLDASDESVIHTLQMLQEMRMVIYRPIKGEYHLWQGSDFDLEEELMEARNQLSPRILLSHLLEQALPPTPVIARRHSFQTGTTRVFEVVYSSIENWQDDLNAPLEWSDGRLIYLLAEYDDTVGDLISSVQKMVTSPQILIAIPNRVENLRESVFELACMEWIRDHSQQLQGDQAARREIYQHIAELTRYVEQRFASLLMTDFSKGYPCTWIYKGKVFHLRNERSLQEMLSHICDSVFSATPHIWSELLNRHKLSSSSVRGLKLLLQGMVKHGTSRRLSIEKFPAEYGMYASILQASGIHRTSDHDSNHWIFARPNTDEFLGFTEVWDAITEALYSADGQRVSIQKLYEILRSPPYGVKNGPIPVFLMAVYKSAEYEIAVYEKGTFILQFDYETIEQFIRIPENFEFQWVEISGAKAEILRQLAPIVGLPKSTTQPLPIVLRILKRIHDLPPYVRTTGNLSTLSLNVRSALHHAVDPNTLLFVDLPEVCGLHSFLQDSKFSPAQITTFLERLQEALRELSGAYDELLQDIQNQISRIFRLRSKTAAECRHELANGASHLLPFASDPKFKAFLVRVTDEILDTNSWYESIGTLLAQRSPVQWRDDDMAGFVHALHEVGRQYFMLEPIVFDVQHEHGESEYSPSDSMQLNRVRLSVTTQYEDHHEQVISIHPEDHEIVEHIYQQLHTELADQEVTIETKIAALAQLSNDLLIQRETISHSNE
ncbi:MAG: hypothetical protein OXF84_08860 [Bacteroidetes bacterium]|nr:hypothetical protein [Bacteroidota bacterium]